MKKIIQNTAFDWQNVDVIAKNRLATRPFLSGYSSLEKAAAGDRAANENVELLNGTWEFKFFESPFQVPENLSGIEFGTIEVPSHWQFSGHGHPHYTDDVLLIPMQEEPLLHYENPTGVYRKKLALEKDGEREYLLRFDGVESAYHLYVNGQQVGYSQVSRNTSEFDISPYLHDGENEIIVVVYQFCVSSVLEKQDMWTLAGIIRDVSLIRRPKIHLSDYVIKAGLDETYTEGNFSGKFYIENHTEHPAEGMVSVLLLHQGEEICRAEQAVALEGNAGGELKLNVTVPEVLRWTAETPNLYRAVIVLSVSGTPVEYYSQQVGFRTIEVKNGLMLINGCYVKLRGMNRHDWSGERGRAIGREEMLRDLKLMKTMNINAVRTAHYPNIQEFYELCGELGFYVVSEADLECNQTIFWTDRNYLSESPLWSKHYLDRVERMVRRDKNYPCIIIWSLGNESGYGNNFKLCYEFCKNYDPERLVHYEEDRQAESADVYSSMYTNHENLEKLGQKTYLGKPHILCEYAHVLGNSPGGAEEYWEILNRYPRLQGAFVWEWIAHGIKETDGRGRSFFKYGGDFGDQPNTGKFCTSGLLSPDRVPYPGWVQFRKAMEPVKTRLESGKLVVSNLYNFISLDGLSLRYQVEENGAVLEGGALDISGIGPMSRQEVPLPFDLSRYAARENVYLTLTYALNHRPAWAMEDGQVVTVEQFPLGQSMAMPRRGILDITAARVETEGRLVRVLCHGLEYVFDVCFGGLVHIVDGGRDILRAPMDLTFWRAPIDNDKNKVLHWREQLIQTVRGSLLSSEISEEGALVLRFRKVYLPLMKNWRVDTVIEYTFDEEGLRVAVSGAPKGYLPESLPRIGLKFAVDAAYHSFQWYGRGPEPNYPDAKLGTVIGLYEKEIADLFVPYVVPQENGAVCDTLSATLGGAGVSPISIETSRPMIFGVSRYSTEMLEKAMHINELEEDDCVHVHIDYNQHGLGSAGWGPEALPKDTLRPDPFQFAVRLRLGQ